MPPTGSPRRPVTRLAALVLAALFLAGCGGGTSSQPPPEPAAGQEPEIAALPPAEEAEDRPITSALDRFCGALLRIVDAEGEGFAPLRGDRLGERHWQGAVVPPGMRSCTIEGDSHPSAVYVCHGETVLGGRAELLEPEFARIANNLDACFARATWYPQSWERGRRFAFAGGEQQQMWRDITSHPKPAVLLKIEEDFDTGAFYMRMAVRTWR